MVTVNTLEKLPQLFFGLLDKGSEVSLHVSVVFATQVSCFHTRILYTSITVYINSLHDILKQVVGVL